MKWTAVTFAVSALALIGIFSHPGAAPPGAGKIKGFDDFRAACRHGLCTPAGEQYKAEILNFFDSACGTFALEPSQYARCVYNVSGDVFLRVPSGSTYDQFLRDQGYLKAAAPR